MAEARSSWAPGRPWMLIGPASGLLLETARLLGARKAAVWLVGPDERFLGEAVGYVVSSGGQGGFSPLPDLERGAVAGVLERALERVHERFGPGPLRGAIVIEARRAHSADEARAIALAMKDTFGGGVHALVVGPNAESVRVALEAGSPPPAGVCASALAVDERAPRLRDKAPSEAIGIDAFLADAIARIEHADA